MALAGLMCCQKIEPTNAGAVNKTSFAINKDASPGPANRHDRRSLAVRSRVALLVVVAATALDGAHGRIVTEQRDKEGTENSHRTLPSLTLEQTGLRSMTRVGPKRFPSRRLRPWGPPAVLPYSTPERLSSRSYTSIRKRMTEPTPGFETGAFSLPTWPPGSR